MESCIHINCIFSSLFSFLCCMVLKWHLCNSAPWALDIKCIWCHATLTHYYYQQIQGSSPLVPWSFECCNCNDQLCFCWMLQVKSYFIFKIFRYPRMCQWPLCEWSYMHGCQSGLCMCLSTGILWITLWTRWSIVFHLLCIGSSWFKVISYNKMML